VTRTGDDELIVLVDEQGNVRGSAPKLASHHAGTPLHLAFSCYVFDRAGNLLVTRRAAAKKTWPGVWTNSCCGHPAPGEDIPAAVARRARDELGTGLRAIDPILPGFRYQAEMASGIRENELCPVFRAESDGILAADPGEVADLAWEPWTVFADAVIHDKRDVSPWCRLQVAELHALGPDPWAWPAAPLSLLPASYGQ
jgi:isopentenyl-diphosphate delta-isomerase